MFIWCRAYVTQFLVICWMTSWKVTQSGQSGHLKDNDKSWPVVPVSSCKAKHPGVNLCDFKTVVSLVVLKMLNPLRELTTRLEKRKVDIRAAFTGINDVIEESTRLRQDVDQRFEIYYHEVLEVAAGLWTTEGSVVIVELLNKGPHNRLRQLVKYFKNQS